MIFYYACDYTKLRHVHAESMKVKSEKINYNLLKKILDFNRGPLYETWLGETLTSHLTSAVNIVCNESYYQKINCQSMNLWPLGP